MAVSFAAVPFGMYYYLAQFSTSPLWQWPLIPDSPLAAGLFGIAAIATVHPASRLFGYGLGAFTALLVILLRARSHRTGVPVASDSDYREAV